MSNEVIYDGVVGESGLTLYAMVENIDGASADCGKFWNGSAFEAKVTANLPTYDVALAEGSPANLQWLGTMPAIGTNVMVRVYIMEYATPSTPGLTDQCLETQEGRWTGTQFLRDIRAAVAATGVAQAQLANVAHGGADATLVLLSATINNTAGRGLSITGTTGGAEVIGTAGGALTIQTQGGNEAGLYIQGHGPASGLAVIGGVTGVGATIQGNAGGLVAYSSGAGAGARFYSGNGAGLAVAGTSYGVDATASDGPAISALVTGGNAAGIVASGFGSGAGIIATGGAGGDGVRAEGGATAGAGLSLVASGDAPALVITGDETWGVDITCGVNITGKTDGAALTLTGNGSGAGLIATGGATGHGISAVGGGTSGSGISTVATTSGDGIVAVAAGENKYDINADIHGTIDTVTTLTNTAGVWDVALPGTYAAGRAGKLLGSLTLAAVADGVWDELTAGHAVVGSYGAWATASKAKTDLIGTATLVAVGRGGTGARLIVQAGDDYLAADGTQASFTITGYAGPSVDGETGVVRIITNAAWRAGGSGAAALELACTLAQTGTTVTVTFDLPAADSATLDGWPETAETDNHHLAVIATVGASTITVGDGPCSVKRAIATPAA